MSVRVLPAVCAPLDDDAVAARHTYSPFSITTLPRDSTVCITLDLEILVSAVIDIHVMRMRVESADRLFARGMKITMSASLPTAIVPFFGKQRNNFAGAVEVS